MEAELKEKQNMKEQLFKIFESEIKEGDWGYVLNNIQDAAEMALTNKEWDSYLKKSNRDANICDGSDFILLNGECFDWRQFKFKAKEIVNAYLNYFTDRQLNKILNIFYQMGN